MIYTDQRDDSLKPLREYTAWVVSPVVWVASLPHNAVKVGAGVKTRDTLEAENLYLREQQLLLQAKLQKLEALEAENHRIRELLASSKSLQDHVLIAEIIAVSQDPYRHQITLNKGTRDKVYRGQALIDATGIMGQVVEVGPSTSQALLITDPDHGIPVEINRTGLQTIALGLGDGQGLKLPFLPSNADVKVGDLLVSSALGGRFPAGYPVGQIYNVKNLAGEHFMEAVAYPSAKLNQGRQALLVWSEHKSTPVPAAVVEGATPATPELAPVAAPTAAAPATSAVTPKPTTPTQAPAHAPATAAKPIATTPAPKPTAAAPAATAKPVVPAATAPKPATPAVASTVAAPKPVTPTAAVPKPAVKPVVAPAQAPAAASAPKPTADQATPPATPEPAPTNP